MSTLELPKLSNLDPQEVTAAIAPIVREFNSSYTAAAAKLRNDIVKTLRKELHITEDLWGFVSGLLETVSEDGIPGFNEEPVAKDPRVLKLLMNGVTEPG